MKKSLLITVWVLLLGFFTGCQKDTSFDSALLSGKWSRSSSIGGKPGTLYEVYNSNHSGKYWDTSDGMDEASATLFSWTLDGSDLLLMVKPTTKADTPVPRTVLKLTPTQLQYEEAGKTYTLSKVQ